MKNAAVLCRLIGGMALVLAGSLPAWSKNGEPALTLTKGARVGIVNLLTPEVTHYHSSSAIQDSFLKTHQVQWLIDSMFMDAVKQRISQMGLEPVLVAPSQGLERGRQEFFIDNSINKGLSKPCADEFTQLASANHVDAFVVLAPGLNDSAHAGSGRRKDLPDYLRGWGFITKAQQPGDKPAVFDMTQVLLVSGTGGTALLRAREPGGEYSDTWSSFTPPADLKEVPDGQLDTLKPIFTGLVGRQANRVLDQIYVVGGP